MKKHLFISLLVLFSCFASSAQVSAGATSAGMTINALNIQLSAPEGQSSFAEIDMDCDAIPELTIKLSKGNPTLCQANQASFSIHNPALEFCKDTSGNFTGNFGRPHYFSFGEALICPGTAEWIADSVYTLGDYGGCISCTGPAKEKSEYIAYRLSGQLGWIKISFDLTNPATGTSPVSLSIDSVLLPCATSSIEPKEYQHISSGLFPNPCAGQTVLYAHQEMHDATLMLFNSLGRLVKQQKNISGSVLPVQLSNLPDGIYMFRLIEKNKIIATHKLLIDGN